MNYVGTMLSPKPIDNPRHLAHEICVEFRPVSVPFSEEQAAQFVDLAFIILDTNEALPIYAQRNIQGLRSDTAHVLTEIANKSGSLLEQSIDLYPDKVSTLITLFTANILRDFCAFTAHAAFLVNRPIQGLVLPGNPSQTYLSESAIAAAANHALRARPLEEAHRSALILPLGLVRTGKNL